MVPGLRAGGRTWTERRLLLFTEYEDTRRWLEQLLREAVAHTARAEERIAVFSGSTSADRREEIKCAFHTAPADDPLRILIATDAAREGLNLQRYCHDLFHIDLPWNPSRLEQRNGRIDRKLQPAQRVYCRYFIYAQRPEDRVWRRLAGHRDPHLRTAGRGHRPQPCRSGRCRNRTHRAVGQGTARPRRSRTGTRGRCGADAAHRAVALAIGTFAPPRRRRPRAASARRDLRLEAGRRPAVARKRAGGGNAALRISPRGDRRHPGRRAEPHDCGLARAERSPRNRTVAAGVVRSATGHRCQNRAITP